MAADGQRHVVAFGGLPGPDSPDPSLRPYLDFLAGLTGRPRPRICLLATAAGDDPAAVERNLARLGATGCEVTHLSLFPMPNVADPADLLLSQDVIFVGGGSVANMLAVWRVHGLPPVMRTAWESGIVLTGVSAGAICWFEGGTTDSFGPDLRPFTAGLGLLPGSYCPHYDAEPRRRPAFTSLVADGTLAAGIACDDGAGAHFTGGTLTGIVSALPGARGYRVTPGGPGGVTETPLPASPLAG
ncbi:MAG: peptidase E [Actinobacteria bacterium]|nr:peptidase E [Actinomycetota bacterium]